MIVVGTFLDEIERRDRDAYVQKMHGIIRSRFMACRHNGGVPVLEEKGLPNVVGLLEVSCKTNINIIALRDLIYDTVTKMKGEGSDSKNFFGRYSICTNFQKFYCDIITVFCFCRHNGIIMISFISISFGENLI